MDKFSYLKNDKQTIYDIYRACRLCGGGAGYKMPIVQNVIDLDTNGVELKQKIQECLQIEVHQDDKMPPLICELCVDKVNDFYEFMEMCRQTNKRTRLRLGLPLHAAKKSTSDSGDCILGVTEPIYETEDDNEPLSKQLKSSKKKEIKKEKLDEQLSKKKDVGKKNFKEVKIKEAEVRVKTEKVTESPSEPRKRRAAAAPSPHAHAKSDDSVKPSAPKTSSKAKPNSPHLVKASLRRELKELLDVKVQYKDEDSSRMKRVREKDPVVEKRAEKAEVPAKKVKIAAAPKPAAVPKPTTAPKPGASPKPAAARKPPAAPRPAPPAHACALCPYASKSGQGLATHVRVHVVTFTNDKLACNPCGEWFLSNEESSAHHKKHKTKPYRCRHCYSVFKMLSDYDKHFTEEDCKPYTEVPDKKCDDCWRTYPTQLLLDQHRCQGPDGRPGGKCLKCNRMYTLLKNLKKHEATCTFRKKGEAIVDPNVEKRLRVTQILLMRCDDVLHRTNGGSYDVSGVDTDFGFDYRYVYPYRYRVKPEPNTGYDTMVSIGDEVKAHYSRDYVHWDSDDTDSDGDVRKIDSLSAISLKTIFSNKLLGKVPKRRRKVKVEKVFDNVDFDMSKDIDSIILNLGQDDVKKNDSANDSDCSESIFGPFKQNDAISENAFDNLLAENDSQDTEKNFDLFNSSGENKDSLNDFEKVNSQINDKEDSQAATNNSIDSGVKNDDEKYDDDSPVDRDNDLEYKENDNASTDTNVIENNDNMSQNTEFSESQNQMDSDDARTGTPIDDTSQNIVKDNDNVDNLEIDSNKPISVTNEDVESASVIDNNEKVEDAAKDNYDSTNVDTPKENIEESSEESNVKVNGQDINSLANYSSDVEMDDKKLMDAIDEQIGENFTNGDENHVENNTVSKDTDDSEFKIVNSDSKTDDFNENNGEIGDKSSVIENSGISDEQNEKVTDLVSKRHSNLRGMDLDNISDDEFNFDA